jgi:hypothetical protein
VKRRILVVWTAVASSLVLQIVGQPVYSVSSPDTPSYPDRVEWVQTVSYGVPASPSAEMALGPSSVGCARPNGATNGDWSLSCL